MILSQNQRAFEYLLYGILSARSADELARMRRLAHAHYSGPLLMELEAEIDARSRELSEASQTETPS